MQPVDFTTLCAACADVRSHWLPARLEQVYQRDQYTLSLALRTLEQRGWLTVSWHPQAARLCIGEPPPKGPDTFTFSEQLRHQLKGLALIALQPLADWERVVDLQFARRPGDPVSWHLYVEVMNKYSNVVLTAADQRIVTVAHQVSVKQSRVRPLQTGQPYTAPPALTDPAPSLQESQDHWQQRVALIPGPVARNLRSTYRGLSPALAKSMVAAAEIPIDLNTDQLTSEQWQQLFSRWQDWLRSLQQETFAPGWQAQGYTVMGWGMTEPAEDIHSLLERYYTQQLNQQAFKQLRHQLQQKVAGWIKKLRTKAQSFQSQLRASETADQHRQQADLLMAHLHEWQPGLQSITLPDFEGGTATIPLNPEQNAVQNAQALYKRHQKLKRSRNRLEPLLADVEQELSYLEQVATAIEQTERYDTVADLETLEEIRAELIEQDYWPAPDYVAKSKSQPDFIQHTTPKGRALLVGRNNLQNDRLTRIATDYDLWFHTQEIPGSHALLRLDAGAVPQQTELEWVANVVAYYSRARQSYQVPVVYTHPKHVYKPKGAQPGMVIYKHETVIWGQPQVAKTHIETSQGTLDRKG